MGILRFNYRSETLGRYVDITVALPTDGYRCAPTPYLKSGTGLAQTAPDRPCYKPGMRFQTVYLIHGGGDDDTLTYRYSNVEEAAQRNHVMLVTPNITNSFGVDTCYTVPYMTFLTEELPTVIQALFPSSPAREDNFIMGYAMGGNVALGCAVNRPDRYHTCVDISGGIGMTFRADTLMKELDGTISAAVSHCTMPPLVPPPGFPEAGRICAARCFATGKPETRSAASCWSAAAGSSSGRGSKTMLRQCRSWIWRFSISAQRNTTMISSSGTGICSWLWTGFCR